MAAVDISGRGQAYCELPVPTERVGSFDTELAVEFFYAFARDAKLTLHVRELAGGNSHHIIEAAFKAVGRTMRHASRCGYDNLCATLASWTPACRASPAPRARCSCNKSKNHHKGACPLRGGFG